MAVHARRRHALSLALATGAVVLLPGAPAQAAEAPVGLGTAGSYSTLAGSTITNTGPTVLSGDLGVHPGSASPGWPPGRVLGATHLADAAAQQAKLDLTTAYNDAAGRTPFTSLASELGGRTLTPGTYRVGEAQLTGALTLDTRGDPTAVFVLQVDSALTTAANSSVVVLGGGNACNVFWKIGSSATLGTGSAFQGTVMAQASISLTTGATLTGRALARTGAVTLDDNRITTPSCARSGPTATGQPSTQPSAAPSATATAGVDTVTPTASTPGATPAGSAAPSSAAVPGATTPVPSPTSVVAAGSTTGSSGPPVGAAFGPPTVGLTTSSVLTPTSSGTDVPTATGSDLPSTGTNAVRQLGIALVVTLAGVTAVRAGRRSAGST